jgi:hypothetical protein
MEAIGKVEAGGRRNGGFQRFRPADDARTRPRIVHGGAFRRLPLGGAARGRDGALLQAIDVDVLDLPDHVRVECAPLRENRLPQPRQPPARDVFLLVEFVQDLERDVELAHGAERPRQRPHSTVQLLFPSAAGHQWKRLTQPASRHARLMERFGVSLPSRGQRTGQRRQALANEVFRRL